MGKKSQRFEGVVDGQSDYRLLNAILNTFCSIVFEYSDDYKTTTITGDENAIDEFTKAATALGYKTKAGRRT